MTLRPLSLTSQALPASALLTVPAWALFCLHPTATPYYPARRSPSPSQDTVLPLPSGSLSLQLRLLAIQFSGFDCSLCCGLLHFLFLCSLGTAGLSHTVAEKPADSCVCLLICEAPEDGLHLRTAKTWLGAQPRHTSRP